MTTTPMLGSTFFGLDITQLSTRLMAIRRRISKRVLMLEFGPASLLLAEATLTHEGVKLRHVSAFPLPPEALDRGIPAEPLKMAGLLKDFCAEKKIPAHRVAVVLPPDLAFQRLLNLPANLTTDEAREFVLNPVNGLQIPFPITQTDFDLFPISLPTEQQGTDQKCMYMLTAIPEALVNPIVEMLQAADLELQLLEVGSHSQLRNHAAELITLPPQQVDLVLELLPDSSNLMLVCCSGLIASERLAAIRNLPELDIEPDQLPVALETGLTAENLLLKDENYLPISDLDLRVLVADLRAAFKRLHLKLPFAEIRRLILTGVNSSHPLLSDVLSEMLGVPTVLAQSSVATGLAEISMDDLLFKSSLGRLTGLALGLLPHDQFLACPLEGNKLSIKDSYHQNKAIAIADFMNSSEAQMGLDLVALEVHSDRFVADESKDDEAYSIDIDAPVSLESSISSDVDSPIDSAEKSADLTATPIEIAEDQVLIDSLTTASSLNEEPLEYTNKEEEFDSSYDKEDLSKSTFEADSTSAHKMSDNSELLESEEQWPSIQASSSDVSAKIPSSVKNDSLELSYPNETIFQNEISPSAIVSPPETDWPSITSIKSVQHGLENEVDIEDHTFRRPATSTGDQQDLIDNQVIIENLDDPMLIEEEVDSCSMDTIVSQDLSLDSGQLSHEIHETSHPFEDQGEELNVPNNNSLEENSENLENSNHDVSSSSNSSLIDESNTLGELRFATDD